MTKTKSSLSQICVLFPLLVIALGCKGDDEEPIPSTGELLWAIQAGGPGADHGHRISTKTDGVIVVSGTFRETISFEDISLASAGYDDIFLTQINSSGAIDWVKSFGGADVDQIDGVAVLPDDSIAVAGEQNNATFGAGEANETTLSGASGYLSLFDEDGQLSSVQTRAGWSNSFFGGEDGSLVICGAMYDETTFGEGEPNETTLTSAGESDIFVAKYSDDGTLAWVRRAGGANGEEGGHDVAVSSDGSVVVVGSCNEATIFGGGEASETTLDCASESRGFVAKYDSDGDFVWVNGLGNFGKAVAIAKSNEIYVSGSFHLVSAFAQGAENETTLTPVGELKDAYLAKFDTDGLLVWVEQMGGSYEADGDAVGALSDGSAIIASDFDGQFTVGDPPVEYSIPYTEDTDSFFIARFSSSGEVEWVKSAESAGSVSTYDLSVATDDTIVLTGSFGDDITFGVGEANETTLAHTDDSDVFVSKFEP